MPSCSVGQLNPSRAIAILLVLIPNSQDLVRTAAALNPNQQHHHHHHRPRHSYRRSDAAVASSKTSIIMMSSTNPNNNGIDDPKQQQQQQQEKQQEEDGNRNNKLPRVDFDKTETIGSTRWMRLETLSYHVPDAAAAEAAAAETATKVLKWDRAVRTTKRSESSVDAVVILAVLRNDPSDPLLDEIVCVKQFRPPVDAYTVELPAGLIDADEDPATAAEREFREETGYVGEATEVLPASYLSPGLTNESACMVRLEVDMSLPGNVRVHDDDNRAGSAHLDGCEADRGLVKLLLPRVGLLEALHELREREGVKVFAAFHALALGMSIAEAAAAKSTVPPRVIEPATTTVDNSPDFPLINLELDEQCNPTLATSNAVTSALHESGFLMVKTPLLPMDLQKRALKAASQFLQPSSSSNKVVTHPSDPKVYAMLQGIDSIRDDDDGSADAATTTMNEDLKEWYRALRETKDALLRCIAVGLGMEEDPDFFVTLHDENNDAMRLLKYPPGDANTGNRCKEHSDYGTLTLLLNDGVGGLEAYVNDEWRPVPYAEGSVVVNIGSILSGWTRQELKATLHRVAGPASVGSVIPRDALLRSVSVPRTSIAYFADPNGDVSTALEGRDEEGSKGKVVDGSDIMNVSDYIRWRSGGEGEDRSGVAFTSTEESRLGILDDLLGKLPY